MAAAHIVAPARVFGELLAEASPDMIRDLLQTMLNAVLSADVVAVVGASKAGALRAGWRSATVAASALLTPGPEPSELHRV
ncbi:MAG: hypothetical protein I3J03_03320 [Actinomyces succiniciruminis]|nr:hypothetical protein [Actinomyces succiniciruminis]